MKQSPDLPSEQTSGGVSHHLPDFAVSSIKYLETHGTFESRSNLA